MEYKLRPWQPGDAKSVAKYANNKKIADNLRDGFPYPYTPGDAEAFVADCLEGDGDSRIMRAIEINGEAAGSIGVFRQGDIYRISAELGYWLAEPYWNCGIMRGAVTEICAAAFDSLDVIRIFAEPFAHNTASRKVLEKAGFRLEGTLEKSAIKNGVIIDSCIYALLRPLDS